jgi:CDP-2,3-bis-(O-geranylgeranyl)-sn-glycerol synthase
LFGPSKTWRGIAVGLATTAAVATLLGYDVGVGLLFGAASLSGDLVSSFIKRRLGIRSSGRAVGLDQIPEALLPLLACRTQLALDWLSVAILVACFFAGSLLLSRAMFLLGIKQQPY